MRTSTRLLIALGLTTIAVGVVAWLVVSIGEMHDKVARHSPLLAIGLMSLAFVAASVSAITATWMFWRLSRPPKAPAKAPEDIIKAAEIQAEQAGNIVAQIQQSAVRDQLENELKALQSERAIAQFHLVVFGTGSSGKTSLINALLGREAADVGPVMGTTRHAADHTQILQNVDGTLKITDTPGLSEIGNGGPEREAEARDLAARGDLLLFVVDHDLIRSEFEPLAALAKQGKRSIVALNKRDRFLEDDEKAILSKLRDRLTGIVPAADVVSIAAAPRPMPIRVKDAAGHVQTVFEPEPPDLKPLLDRIVVILKREGESLRAGNMLLRAHLVSKSAQDQLTIERKAKAVKVIEKFQWVTAGTVFANPVPALDLMATGAVQFQMITEIARAFDVELSASHGRMICGQMVQMLLKLGMVEAATSLIAGLFKSTFVGFAAGGAVQATTMAYLTHISGFTFLEYFERGQSWGDGGMQAALVRQFDLNSRADFLKEFAQQAINRVVRKVSSSANASRNGD
jgi:uncharacterized protein (DUF697 family)/GTPase SAR1 family protein